MFVDLVPLGEPDQVLPAVAAAVGLRDGGVRSLSGLLQDHLLDRSILSVLDKLGHLLPASWDLAALLARCPGVRILATSRAPLEVPGEQLLAVDPLPVPDLRAGSTVEELPDVPSVSLFVARVRGSQADFALTAGTGLASIPTSAPTWSRGGGRPARRRGEHQPRDRAGARHQRAHGGTAPRPRAGEARCPQPYRGGHVGWSREYPPARPQQWRDSRIPSGGRSRWTEAMPRTRNSPLTALSDWTDALNRHDPDGVAAAFAPAGVLLDTGTGQSAAGCTEIRLTAAGFIACSPTCTAMPPSG